MKRIPLTQGKFALVDDEDFEFLNQWKWKKDVNGYAVRNCRKVNRPSSVIRMHREIIEAPNKMEVDHKNNNRLDNQKNNLRLCTRAQNIHNNSLSKRNKSGYKGVCWNKEKKKWEVHINAWGKRYFLGYHIKLKKAAEVYRQKAKFYFGDFANA